jgi:DNA-binding transcriptional LysR family regulator
MSSLRKKLPSANALFAFEAAARCGNFSKAALELYVTQPAVSRMLARMEDHLGVKLFERVHGGIRLTEYGQILYQRISDGFRGIEAALDEIEARRTGTDMVTLSVSTAFTTHWLMPRMDKLRKAFPSIDLRYQLIAGAIGGPVDDVDLGMRFLNHDETGENGAFVMPELMLPLCSPTYARQARQAGEGGDTIVILGGGERDWHHRFASFRKSSRGPTNILEFSDYAIVIQAALLGQGIALGWLNVTSHWICSGALIPSEQELSITGRTCHLLHPANKPMRSAVAEIRDWIVEEMQSDLATIDRLYPTLRLSEIMARSRAQAAAP